jgi:putative ribosome biogenesis GTPase RsgA
MAKHNWTIDETAKVTRGFLDGKSPKEIADTLPQISLRSIQCKYGNCKHLRDGDGLSHVSKMHKKVWEDLVDQP